MPDWLRDTITVDPNLTWQVLAIRLVVSFALGCLVALVYRCSRRTDATSSFLTTLVMLTILIAMVTLVIGNSVARAFSLVGALAIVRFRTIVEDTRDTAFVILAVAVGMAAGTGFLEVPLIGLPIAALAAYVFQPRASKSFTLIVRITTGFKAEEIVRPAFEKHLSRAQLLVTATARQGSALELTYSVALRDPDGALAFVNELNALEGMQGVELRLA